MHQVIAQDKRQKASSSNAHRCYLAQCLHGERDGQLLARVGELRFSVGIRLLTETVKLYALIRSSAAASDANP
jgi:hypothetical protein